MRTLAFAVFLMLAGCGPLVQIGGNSKPPAVLLTLRAETGKAVATSGTPVLVTLPAVPGALRTLRIPVTTGATELAYLPDANWIEQPNLLFQRLLGEVVQARSGRPVVDERNVDVVAGLRLSGRLVEFGLDARSSPKVHVRYDAILTSPVGGLIGSRRFEAGEPVASETGPDVARALNTAANGVAQQVGDWIASAG